MRQVFPFLIFLFVFSAKAQYPSFNVSMLSHFNDTNLVKVDGDQIWNDVMGWHDTTTGKEYLIAGTTDSIYFFDISNPSQMVLCDVEFGKSRNAINRDYDVYSHYVYCVSDRTSPLGALQIFDMQYLPDSVHKVYENGTLGITTHTIFIDTLNAKLYMCTNNYGMGISALDVLSLRNPERPTLMTRLNPSGFTRVHEAYVRNDTAYLSCENPGLFIYNMRDTANPVLLGSIRPPYPQNGYNHSSWLDSTGRYLMFSDEVPFGLGIKIYDVKDISAPDFVSVFNSNIGATPHNAYWKGRFAYASSYEDGVQIYDTRSIASPTIAGFFDTYPQNPVGIYNGFHGCWGVWPFLPSGLILASDMSEGLFVLKTSISLSTPDINEHPFLQLNVFPNPFVEACTLQLFSSQKQTVNIKITSLEGKELYQKEWTINKGQNEMMLNQLAELPNGLMHLSIAGQLVNVHKTLLKL